MSAEKSSALPNDVRITYHTDGSATVNDVPVAVEPGQNVRDAAYQAAVGLVMAAGASGPVAATSVEADGTRYPLTLYPLKAVLAANALVNAAAISAAGNAAASGGASEAGAVGAGVGAAGMGAMGGPAGAADPSAVGAAAADGAIGLGIGGGFEDQYRRARRAWYRPTLSISWLVAGACACMLLSVLATVLLRQNDPSLVRLSVDTENEVGHSAAARAIGRAMASLPDVVSKPTPKTSASKHPVAPSASPLAHPPAKASAVGDDSGNNTGDNSGDAGSGSYDSGSASVDVPQPATTVPKPVPGPKPKPAPDSPAPASVTDLTVALVGGDRTDPTLAYVITVSTSNTNPVTLTYTYSGSRGRGTVKRSMVLSGDSEYVLSNLILAQPYCGGAVTMTAATSPIADDGNVVATTQPGC